MTADIAWKSHVVPSRAGAHPDNRGKFGIDATHSQNLGNNILKVGWSWRKCADSSAIQSPPEPWLKFVNESNRELSALSGDLIPPISQIDILTMGGGHANCFLRQVLGGVRAVNPELQDPKGFLNKEVLTIGREQFKVALETGMLWVIFHWQTPFFSRVCIYSPRGR